MPPKKPYNKPAITYVQQMETLRGRGMVVSDEESAQFCLQHINYYRLGGYWLSFEEDHSVHRFKVGTTFNSVLQLYEFDRALRFLLFDAIERIEISVRAQWAYNMGHMYGPHSYLDERLVRNKDRFLKSREALEKEVKRSKEAFVRHFGTSYSDPFPPIWAVCEVMPLGLLSLWYGNLGPKEARRAIADIYGLDESLLASWLHHLSIVRNICAHHARLWDRRFVILPQRPRTKPSSLATAFIRNSDKVYNTLLIVLYLMDCIAPDHNWRNPLKGLLQNHKEWLKGMGFPTTWGEYEIWQ